MGNRRSALGVVGMTSLTIVGALMPAYPARAQEIIEVVRGERVTVQLTMNVLIDDCNDGNPHSGPTYSTFTIQSPTAAHIEPNAAHHFGIEHNGAHPEDEAFHAEVRAGLVSVSFVIDANAPQGPVITARWGSVMDGCYSANGQQLYRVVEPAAGGLTPVSPARVHESRTGDGMTTVDGQSQGTGRMPADSTREVLVAGRAGVPTDADAVLLNVTSIFPGAPGFFTVYPCGATRPAASNVNFSTGDVVPNAVLAGVGTGGTICVYTSAASDIVVDVNGYVPDGGTPTSVVPARLLETRSGAGATTVDGQFQGVGRQAAGATLELLVTGRGGVAADAAAVLLNLTAVFPDAPGFLTVYPCGETRPGASNVNYAPGDVVPNAVLAKVGAGGKVCIYTHAATDILADVNGYVPVGGTPTSVVPARLLETRSGAGATTVDGQFQGVGRQAAGATLELLVTGRGGVAADAAAVLLNLTAVFPDAPGFLTVYPCGETRPGASNVNYAPGDVVPNAVLAKVGAGGKVCIYTHAATDILADVNGYVSPAV